MSAVDWIGFSGVMLLLSAYFLVAFNMIKPHGFTYITLNCIGATIACLAAVLLHYTICGVNLPKKKMMDVAVLAKFKT